MSIQLHGYDIDLCMSYLKNNSIIHVAMWIRNLYICKSLIGVVDDWKQTFTTSIDIFKWMMRSDQLG